MTDTYLEDVPEEIDKTQAEWDELSYHAQYYHANNLLEAQKKEKRSRTKRKQELSNKRQRKLGCKNCDENMVACLDWHHLNDDKDDTVADLIWNDRSVERIEAEMEKCIVLCANCHRKLHAEK